MHRHFLHRPSALATRAATSAALLALFSAVPAAAATGPGSTPAPHLDTVEQTLRQVSPGLEGQVWERTGGNILDASAADGGDWLAAADARLLG